MRRARVPPTTTLPQHSHRRTRASLVCPPLPTRVAGAGRAALASRSHGRLAARAARQGGALYVQLSVADIERTKILNNEAVVRAPSPSLPLPPRVRPPLASSQQPPSPPRASHPSSASRPKRASALPTHGHLSGVFLARAARRVGWGGSGAGGSAAPRRDDGTARRQRHPIQTLVRADAPVPRTPHLCIARGYCVRSIVHSEEPDRV